MKLRNVNNAQPFQIESATLDRLRSISGGSMSDERFNQWVATILDLVADRMSKVVNDDPGLQVVPLIEVDPIAWVTVRVPKCLAEELLSRSSLVVRNYGRDVVLFAWDVEKADKARVQGKSVKPRRDRLSVLAWANNRGRRDVVPFQIEMPGWQWKQVNEIAKRIDVRPVVLIRAALWARWSYLREFDQEQLTRNGAAQI